jgi:pSer/pThr/pTyr-binding forkhead associated (FHA) protein
VIGHATRVGVRKGAPERAGAALLIVTSPVRSLQGRRHPLTADVLDLGRGEAPDLLSLPDEEVSRIHARIVRTGGGHLLVDLESTNGTLLNGEEIHEETLRDGDLIQVGTTVLRYEITVASDHAA